MKTISDVVKIEEKGCITFSRVCVNLGKVANLGTGREEYFCAHHFPDDCSVLGCPKMMDMASPDKFILRNINPTRLERMRQEARAYAKMRVRGSRS